MKENVNIIYIAPVQLLKELNVNISNYIHKLLYSIISINENVEEHINTKIKIYVDFDGFSILRPIYLENCEVIFSNTLENFKKNVISREKDDFLFVDDNQIIKPFNEIMGDFMEKNGNGYYVIKENAIDKKIKYEYIENTLKEYYSSIYDKIIENYNLIN